MNFYVQYLFSSYVKNKKERKIALLSCSNSFILYFFHDFRI